MFYYCVCNNIMGFLPGGITGSFGRKFRKKTFDVAKNATKSEATGTGTTQALPNRQ